ncbi:MAG: diaminobutyrate--2-oxoglutarate transaminase family protein [Actinomycetota bacterium]|nr:diaminobutyrate--2-oxoglutarate transaminase family protein [Actinomycetota bacterium]
MTAVASTEQLAPSVSGPLPGPRSAALLERQETWESSARTYPRRLPIAIDRGEGSYVVDLDGNVFIDFLSGAGSLPLGHSHPELIAAIQAQLPRFQHGLDFPTEIRDEFASMQLALLPDDLRAKAKIAFCGPTGANAVEGALKLCKTATGRSEIVAFHGSYHGGSHGAMAASALVSQKERVAGQMPGVHFFPYPYALRSALAGDADSLGSRCVQYLERSLRDPHGGVALPAAVILEVVQGEGGVIPAPTDFLQGVRRVTRELGIPLILDEIQCGFGRTGTWFAFDQHGIAPDVVVASKGIGGLGMPAAIVLYDGRLDAWSAGAHTGTFRGNQLAFAAGVEAIRIIERDGLLENVTELGALALEGLSELADEHKLVAEARGMGLMLGLELVDPETGEPNQQAAVAVQRGALERGLIVELGGRDDAVVRMLPPLNVTRETLDQALGILREALAVASSA